MNYNSFHWGWSWGCCWYSLFAPLWSLLEFSWLSLWQVCAAYLVTWPNLLSWMIWTRNTLHSLGLLYVCAHGHSEAREHLEMPSGLWWFNILLRRVDCPCHYGASWFHLLASGHKESRWPWGRLYFVVRMNPGAVCSLEFPLSWDQYL